MGDYWIRWAPDYIGAEGLNFRVEPGFEDRARSSGGLDLIMAIQCHQTVSNTTPYNDMRYMWYNASTRPIGNIYLDRTGLVHCGAAGASNTAGRGGPRYSSRGTIPLDVGNTRVIAIEAANDGYGEVWTPEQCDAFPRLVAALIRGVNAETPGPTLGAGDSHAHFEWAPTRKVDPRGPSNWADGPIETWDMDAFRGDVFAILNPPPPPEPPEEDDMALSDEDVERIANAVWDRNVNVLSGGVRKTVPIHQALSWATNSGDYIRAGVNRLGGVVDKILAKLSE